MNNTMLKRVTRGLSDVDERICIGFCRIGSSMSVALS